MSQTFPYRAAASVVLAMTLIVLGDAAGKGLLLSGFSPYFVAWARFALAAAVLLPLSGLTAAELPSLLNWRIVLRAGLIIGGICSILTALQTVPVANAFGGFFIGPVIAYFLSAILLKETISYTRTALLLVSFLGVLLVVKPGFGMSSGMAFAVLAGCFHGSYLVATRWLAGAYRPRFLLLSQLLVGAVVLAPFGLSDVPPIDMPMAGLIGVSALGSASGNYILVMVNRRMPANQIAPLIYSQLLAATLVGLIIFSEWPDGYSLLGLLVIFGAGISSLWIAGREGRQSTPPVRPS